MATQFLHLGPPHAQRANLQRHTLNARVQRGLSERRTHGGHAQARIEAPAHLVADVALQLHDQHRAFLEASPRQRKRKPEAHPELVHRAGLRVRQSTKRQLWGCVHTAVPIASAIAAALPLGDLSRLDLHHLGNTSEDCAQTKGRAWKQALAASPLTPICGAAGQAAHPPHHAHSPPPPSRASPSTGRAGCVSRPPTAAAGCAPVLILTARQVGTRAPLARAIMFWACAIETAGLPALKHSERRGHSWGSR
eukprot:357392-Chlamydomonas_euryale.AAC.34